MNSEKHIHVTCAIIERDGQVLATQRSDAMSMPLEPTWPDIAIRLGLTMLACAVIGLNRGARGHAAGFRTTILVGLAAAVAMIQANILLPKGKHQAPLP